MLKIERLLVIVIVVCSLTSCASIVAVGAAGTAATTTSDRRSLGTQIDDKTITARVRSAINKIPLIEENSDISVHVYNSQVLLTGQSLTQEFINLATQAAQNVAQVSKVHNQIRLGAPIPTTSTLNDIWLGTKIRTLMSTDENVPLLKLDLIVEDSEAFIMGQLTKEEATATVELVRNVKGITKVVRVMELISN